MSDPNPTPALPLPTEALTAARIERMAQSTSQWITDHYLEIIIAFAVGTITYMVLGFLKQRARAFADKQENRFSLSAIVGRTLGKTGQIFMVLASARLVVGLANAPGYAATIIGFLFTVAAAFQVAVWAREIILGMVERRAMDSEDANGETLANAMTLIKIVVTVVLFAIAAIMVLDNLGVDVTGLIAGLGVGGIAIGLAAQGIFSDLFAALSIIFDKPFKRGETISFDSFTGTVEKIGLKSTRLRSVMGEEIIISNTNLLGKELVNFTRLDRRRTRYGIGVIYQTSPDEARRIPGLLKEIVEANDAVFVRSGFVGFGDSSINFELDFDIMSADYDHVYMKRHDIGLAILQKFNEEGLEFAYPTQTTFTAAPDGEMILPYPAEGFRLKSAAAADNGRTP